MRLSPTHQHIALNISTELNDLQLIHSGGGTLKALAALTCDAKELQYVLCNKETPDKNFLGKGCTP